VIPQLTLKRVIFGFSSFWLVWLLIHFYVLMDFEVPLDIAFIDAFISQSFFLLVAGILFITLKYYQPTEGNFFYLRIWAFLLSTGATAATYEVLKFRFEPNPIYTEFLYDSLTIRFLFQILLVGMVTVMLWMFNFHKLDKSLNERKQLLEDAAREAELFNLRQQLQPHFLFNSLNSISALAGSKPELARTMVQQLSEFLRHTLKKDDKQLVSLKDELYQLNLYLQIEKVRFGHRLLTSVQTEPNCEQMLLPVLVLQPLVENAIKFGLYDTLQEVLIAIDAKCEDGTLVVEITNPFDPNTSQAVAGTGFGLESIRRRMYLLYGRNDLITTQTNEQLFTARITIPQS
jgi:two-component system, LytTR family, sensor kinase